MEEIKTSAPKKRKTAPKQKSKAELERDIQNGDKAFADAIKESQNEKDLIRFYIPKELSPGNDFFERSFNGHVIRLKVGSVVELPQFLVDYIESCIEIRRMSDEQVLAYKTGAGKEIDFS